MSTIAIIILGIYTVALLYVTIYCLMQLHLLYAYKRGVKEKDRLIEAGPRPEKFSRAKEKLLAPVAAGNWEDDRPGKQTDFPFITVQLPIYNEMYVVERLIDSIVQFDYPRDRFEIHILDDSTDETVEITKRKVLEYREQGFRISQIRRKVRKGYKAGALKEGMALAKGEFIAIFDADFLPRPDFLKKTLPYFQDEEVGVVQTRWEHLNEDYSLITRLQALQLNVHFSIEQSGRMRGNYLLQFNGTAGIWRREAIEDAGGWEADTLTEDLDLSIRTQLKGWKIKYLQEVGSPAELPAEMNSFKSQQFRWMKGGAETAKKMLPTVWRSELKLGQKIQATFHLLASTIFLFVFVIGVFSVPLLFLLNELISLGFSSHYFAYFLIGLLSIAAVYYVGNVQVNFKQEPFGKLLFKFIFLFPLFLALSMGLSLHNSIAVLQGYFGKKSPFIRTPKFNIQTIKDTFATKGQYLHRKLSLVTVFEGLLSLYFLGAVIGGIYLQHTTFIVFHLMLFIGYGAIFYFTVRHLSLK